MDWQRAEARIRLAFAESPGTLRNYLGTWRLFRAWLGDQAPTEALAQDWLWERPGAKATLQRHKTALVWLLGNCMGVTARLKVVRAGEERLPRALTRGEVEAIVGACRGPQERGLVAALYGGGLRIAEALALEGPDLRDGVVRVRGKGRREALGTLPTWAAQALGALAPVPTGVGRGDGRLFPWDYWEARRRLRALGARAGVRELNPHVLRHTAATHLLQGGASLAHIQRFLRHKNLATTSRYLHLASEDLRPQMALLEIETKNQS